MNYFNIFTENFIEIGPSISQQQSRNEHYTKFESHKSFNIEFQITQVSGTTPFGSYNCSELDYFDGYKWFNLLLSYVDFYTVDILFQGRQIWLLTEGLRLPLKIISKMFGWVKIGIIRRYLYKVCVFSCSRCRVTLAT